VFSENVIAATCNLRSYQLVLPDEEQFRIKARQGKVWLCVDFRAVDLETGEEVLWDDHSYGELLVRGPWVARAYLGDSGSNEKFADGCLHIGDVVTIEMCGRVSLFASREPSPQHSWLTNRRL
jgi:acyl-CoA synthetase (AMP-forming)/AMP-acid ligase II